MPFSEDGHAVGHLGAGGENEPFRVGVRLLASWRDLAHGDAGGGQRGVEGGSELPGSITDEDFERRCCVKPSRDLDAADFPPRG
jgi:hypothetical protein